MKTWSLFITSSQPSTDAVQIKRIKMPEKQTVKENVRTNRNKNDGDAKTQISQMSTKDKGSNKSAMNRKENL